MKFIMHIIVRWRTLIVYTHVRTHSQSVSQRNDLVGDRFLRKEAAMPIYSIVVGDSGEMDRCIKS